MQVYNNDRIFIGTSAAFVVKIPKTEVTIFYYSWRFLRGR